MFIDRLVNDGNTSLLEQWLRFSDARQSLLAEDVVNASTPGYTQKDLSLDGFQSLLREKLDQRDASGTSGIDYSDVQQEVDEPTNGILFHDGNNRSMEQLMSDQAKNAMMHNLAVELLRRQYATLEMAIKERVS